MGGYVGGERWLILGSLVSRLGKMGRASFGEMGCCWRWVAMLTEMGDIFGGDGGYMLGDKGG